MRNKLNIFVNRIYDFVMRSYHYSPIYAFYDFIWWCCFYLRPFFAYNLSAYAIKKKTQWLDNYYNNKYQDIIERFKNSPVSVKKVIEFHIWFFWGQGEKQMPLLVRACYHQLLSLHGNVVLVTNDNLSQYICLSSVITDRLKRKKITWANYSDIVRNALLSKYGGIWLDATVWVPDKIPFDKLYDLNFYTANSKLPIANRSICFWSSLKWNWSSWCLYTNIENHLIFSFVGEMLQTTALREKYWPDYVIQDYFIYLACRIFPQVTMEMEKAQKWECNGRGEFATLMNRPYDQDAYYRLIKKSFVFKLSFRSKWITETVDGKQTFYGWVLSHQ